MTCQKARIHITYSTCSDKLWHINTICRFGSNITTHYFKINLLNYHIPHLHICCYIFWYVQIRARFSSFLHFQFRGVCVIAPSKLWISKSSIYLTVSLNCLAIHKLSFINFSYMIVKKEQICLLRCIVCSHGDTNGLAVHTYMHSSHSLPTCLHSHSCTLHHFILVNVYIKSLI